MSHSDETVEYLMGLARITAHRFGFHDDESHSHGYLIVAKCLTLHDESREATLRTYTITALRNEFRRLRDKEANNNEIICDPIEMDQMECPPVETSSPLQITTQIIQSLPRKYRNFVTAHWIKGLSLRKIASANKVSVAKVRKILDEAMAIMRSKHEES